jgi:hypothetical protein
MVLTAGWPERKYLFELISGSLPPGTPRGECEKYIDRLSRDIPVPFSMPTITDPDPSGEVN